MDITYLNANKFAKACKLQENFACKERKNYRVCDRALCCGFCNLVDICSNICQCIIAELED